MNQLAKAVQKTVNSRAKVMVKINIFSGKFIAVPMIVSLIDSFHASLSDLFIHLKYQIDRFVLARRACSVSI